MPPEGFDTVTLPSDLIAQIDDHAKSIGAESRADAIESLLEGYDHTVNARVADVESDVIGDIADETAAKVVRELETVLR